MGTFADRAKRREAQHIEMIVDMLCAQAASVHHAKCNARAGYLCDCGYDEKTILLETHARALSQIENERETEEC